MELLNKLEEFKQLGMYGVSFNYGEGVGCDDRDVKKEERSVIVVGNPVGCLGEARMIYVGKVKDFLTFNLKTKPKIISNPPKREEYEKGGYYIWGTEDSVDRILNNPIFGKWVD